MDYKLIYITFFLCLLIIIILFTISTIRFEKHMTKLIDTLETHVPVISQKVENIFDTQLPTMMTDINSITTDINSITTDGVIIHTPSIEKLATEIVSEIVSEIDKINPFG